MDCEKYIGLDIHQATISVAVLDSTGKLVMESILETKAATILQFFAGLDALVEFDSRSLLIQAGQELLALLTGQELEEPGHRTQQDLRVLLVQVRPRQEVGADPSPDRL